EAKPTSCYHWFYGFNDMTTIENIEYLNTSEVTDMSYMFDGCTNLTSLDLNKFNTAKVIGMDYMFDGCTNLETILVANDWTTTSVTTSDNMFNGCTSLKGSKGTTYADANPKDKTYAHRDGGTSDPGYLTYKGPYAYLSNLDGTLTFYYDDQRDSNSRRDGTTYDLNIGTNKPDWIRGSDTYFTKVVFDETFANYYPTTCYMWFSCGHNLTTIENIEYLNTSQVKNMSNMFADCKKLETLNLSHFNTAEVTDMSSMFDGCNKLETLDLSHFNTANVTKMDAMFSSCQNLTTLDISNFNTANVTSMDAMFSSCQNLTTLDISNFNTQNVEKMRTMFVGCGSLKTIYVSNEWTTNKVGNGYDSGMFYGCTSLVGGKGTTYNSSYTNKTYARIDDPDNSAPGYLTYKCPYAFVSTDEKTLTFYYDGQSDSRTGGTPYSLNTGTDDPEWRNSGAYATIQKVVFDKTFASYYPTTCYRWFSWAHDLTTIENIENLNTSEVKDMSQMFAHCEKLETIDLSNFNTEEVTDMSGMFSGCTNLETIYVSNKWDTDAVTSASNSMFENCTKLKGYQGTAYTSSNTGLTYAHVDGGTSNPGYLSFKPYAELSADGKTLTFYCDGDKASKAGDTYYVEYISYNNLSWSGKCGDVETVVFDASFDGYRPTRCNHWFSNFKKLKTITNLNYLHTDNVTNMQGMFEKCEALENLTLPETFKTDMVENMTWMFGGCENLETLSLPNSFNTGNVTLMMSMFNSCKKLTETTVDLSKLNTAKAENMREMFRDCIGFKELDFTKYPNFTTDNVYTMFYMFNGCCELETLNISTFNTAKVQNMGGMFSGCSKIEELDLSNFDTNSLCEIPDKGLLGMFAGCKTLKTLDLRTFKTANIKQWQQVFNGCTNLSTILVSRINWSTNNCVYDNNMFDNCLNLIGNYGAMPKDEVGTGISEANWNENGYLTEGKYKIFYNGIDEDDNTFDTYTDAVTEYIDQAVTLTTPTKPGYIFDGWTRVYPDGTEETKVASVTISATEKGNRIYKANWVKAYTMRFETDGGTSVHADIIVAAGTDISAEVNPIINKINTTSKLGYEFVSWDKDIPTTMPAEDVTITAQWKLVDYTITIDYADGKLPEGKTNPETYNIETPTFTLEKPERTGYSFAGWYTGKGVDPDGIIAQGSYDNIAYTATWTANKYTITFDPDNGDSEIKITQDYDSPITKPADPTKEHYVFQGWYPALPATMPAKDMKLTAQWNDNRRTIVFDTNGGSDIASITQDIGTAITAPADPTREHYDFTGWDKDIPTTMPAENMTITAQWQIHSHKLTIDPANGTAATSATVAYGEAIATPAEPARTGYTFKGWDTEIPATMPDEDLTITAQWEVRKYTITFTDEDGNNLGSVTEEYGKPIEAPANPTREGYDFVKWDADFPMPMPAEDVTVKATWKIHTHTITFDTKGGTAIAAITQDYGTAIAAPQNPEKEGHTFTAWDKTIPATMPDEDLTITAQWEVNQYTLTFTDGDGNVIAAITDDFGAPIAAPADPVRKGFTFLGWDKAIPATMPADNLQLTITALWRDDRQQIVASMTDSYTFPTDAAKYCNGTETSLTLDFSVVTGVATDYSITFDNGALPSQDGALGSDNRITVSIPEGTPDGEYRGSVIFTGDADVMRPSDAYPIVIAVNAPRKVAVQLYSDVLIADNHDSEYTAYQWFRNGSELTGETQQYYTSQSLGGTYVVRVTDRNGDTYNSCPLVIGAAQPTVSQSVKIYPNPTKAEERFTVEIDGYDESKSYNLLIYSNNGALVEQISGAQRQTSLTLPHGN
ncbi:MAG: BspA family leucine-rich repeat surface protein, partial [Salinivirgaceae bacterium]|nr:BspA family leucine-rich repeat surface protein [Salinivirgaceae bacterium]